MPLACHKPRHKYLPLLLAALSLHGCAQAPREAGVIRLTQVSDAASLDPAKAYDTTCIPYVRVLYRGLLDYDDNAALQPEVARSYSASPDGKSYTFTLRDDVFFHSGRRVVAEDFRYAIERVLNPKTASDGSSFYNVIVGAEEFTADLKKPLAQRTHPHISGIEVPDQNTIRFRLKERDSTFLNILALPFAYAVPREHIEKLEREGKSFSDFPDGDGPFKLKEWTHDARLILERNGKYFHRDLPKASRIEVQMGNSSSLQIMKFEQGQTDVLGISDANAPDFLRLKDDPHWKPHITHAPMLDVRYIALNCEMKPFTDKRVRQAMNYAINRARIVSFLAGRATQATGVLPPDFPAFNPALKGYEYNPQKAKDLIRQAGMEGKFPRLEMWYSINEPWYAKAAQSIQADLKQIGITITTRGASYPELKAKAGSRRGIEMAIMGWSADFTDASNFFDPLLNGKSITPISSPNRAFYSNPQVNKLLDAALIEPNQSKRTAMYQAAEKTIVDDAPWVFLHHTERYAAQQPWVQGFKLHPMWSQRLEFVGAD